MGHAAVLAANLPASSRTARDIEPRLAWSQTDYLLAAVVDNLAALRYEHARANGAKRAQRPKPTPRPGEAKKEAPRRKVHVSKRRLDELLFSPRQ